jgi:hypothetical protein
MEGQPLMPGTASNYVNAQKQRNEPRPELPTEPPKPHTLRWYWTLYKHSDHWLGDLSVGQEGLSESTRLQRTGLIESLLPQNGERPFAVLTRKVIKAEMKARTPSQAGNLLSALRGMIRWMIDEDHLNEDDDPTIGLKSGKAKASRESGGFVPWTEEDMALHRAKWPLGTEARLMFDILHYTFLRLGDAHRFGPPHLRQIVRKMAVQIATEKSRGQHHRHGAGASPICGKPAGSSRRGDYRRGGIHRESRARSHYADEQEGMGSQVQEIRGARRRQRAEEKLPWRAQGAGRGRGLR